jgi:hypothetical protein
MACNSLTSILKSCSNNQGGIYSVWINETDNVTGTTVSVSAHTITGISATTDFTTFEFNRNVGSVVIDPKIDLSIGSTYFEAKISLVFHRREAAKSRALYILGEGQRYLDIIFLDANGIYWYVDHAQLDGGTEETGVTKADGSKYTVTFKADMSTRPYAVDSTIVPALIS